LNVGFRKAHLTIYIGSAAAGHELPFTCGVARTFKRPFCLVTGHPIVKDNRSFIGQSGQLVTLK
jgi:hypothetical protein